MIDIDIKKYKNHYVFYSGGCDSTLLLHSVAQAAKNSERDDINVHAISSVPWFLTDNKRKSEQASRDRFFKEMKLRGINNIQRTTFSIDADISTGRTGNGGLPQACLWAIQAIPFIDDDSALYFGSISDDTFWGVEKHFIDAITNLATIVNVRNLSVSFPLRYFRKLDIVKELQELNLMDCTWTCELPPSIGERCNHCVPCQLQNATTIEIECSRLGLSVPEAIKIIKESQQPSTARPMIDITSCAKIKGDIIDDDCKSDCVNTN